MPSDQNKWWCAVWERVTFLEELLASNWRGGRGECVEEAAVIVVTDSRLYHLIPQKFYPME